MANTKISEYSSTPGNNTDIDGINIAEGCAPSGINNAIRELMSQLKDFQAGTAGDSFNGPHNGTVGATTPASGAFTTLSTTGNTTLGNDSGDVITINGTTTFGSGATVSSPLALSAGTASAPALTTTGDTNTGIFFPAADTIAFAEGGVESLRIDGSGNLGLGVTPSAWNGDYKAIDVSTYATLYGRVTTPTSGFSSNSFRNAGGSWIYKTTSGASRYEQDSGFHIWSTAPSGTAGNAISFTQAMALNASGDLLVGNTSKLSGGIGGIDINRSSGAGLTLGTSGTSRAFFYVNSANNSILWETVSGVTALVVSGGSGGVSLANGATSWAAASDERLKTTVTPFAGALQKVGTLRAGTGRYLSDAESVSRSFLVAQDVQAVLPEAVDVAADEQGTLSLRYTDTIPLLVAAIQELKAEFDAYKASHP
jgi:hypothetical protein